MIFFFQVMAIRREDQSLWERRAPLGPQHVRKLIKEGVKVIVQPSNRRAYPMQVIITIEVTKSLGTHNKFRIEVGLLLIIYNIFFHEHFLI